jgi:hypothetical protein
LRVFVEKDRLVAADVPTTQRPRIAELAGSRYAAMHGGYTLPASAAGAGNLRAVLPDDALWSDEALGLLESAARAQAARRHREAADVPDLIDGRQPPAWLHQRQAFAFAQEQEAAALWIAMGGGKGRVAVNLALQRAAELQEPLRVLVTCPKSVLDDDGVWQREFSKWAPDGWKVGGLVRGRHGKPKKDPSVADRLDQLERDLASAAGRQRHFVGVVPWDSFWRGKLLDWLLDHRWHLWIQDEIHKIKAPGGKASKAAERLRPRAERRLALTGTLLPHSRLDAYAIFRALDPGVFGTSYSRFKRKYAVTVPLPNTPKAEKVVGFQNTDDGDREVLGLQEPRWVEHRFNLQPATRAIYRELDTELVADIANGTVEAGNALVRFLRLQQTCSGVVTTADGVKARVGHELEHALEEKLDEIGHEPIVVVCRFVSDLDAVHAAAGRLGMKSAELSGRVKSLDVWKAGAADVLALQIQAGSTGIDLTRARYCVLASVGFSLGDYLQVLERLDRPGQVSQVVFVKLIPMLGPEEDTVTGEVYEALERREDGIKSVIRNRQRR